MKRFRNSVVAMFIAAVGTTMTAPLAMGFELIGVHAETGDLYDISTSDAIPTLIGSTGIEGFGSLEFAPDGTLYGFTTGPAATLYTIDPVDLSTNVVGSLGLDFVFDGSLVFAPDGTVYGTNNDSELNPQLFTLDPVSGEATVVGTIGGDAIGGGRHDINAMAWREDGFLVGLDRITNSLLAIDPADASSSLIALVDPVIGAVGGMAVAPDTAYFVTSGPGGPTAGSNELYSFHLFTGEHALIGGLSPTIEGVGISGLAYVPEPASLLLMLLGGFAVLRRR